MVKRIYFNCGEVEPFSLMEEGKGYHYILPSQEALISRKRKYLLEKGGTTKVHFMTFDNIVSQNIRGAHAGPVFQRFILKKILQRLLPSYNYKGFVEILVDFFRSLEMQRISREDLAEAKDPLLQSLAPIYGEYQDYFKTRNLLTDKGYGRATTEVLDVENVIIDGFYDFRRAELGIIENLAKSTNVILNLPFAIKGFDVTRNIVEELKVHGFQVVMGEELTVEEYVKGVKIQAIRREEKLLNGFFGHLKQILMENPPSSCKVISGDEEVTERIFLQSSLEELEFNGDFHRGSPLTEELKQLFRFFENPDKSNVLNRLRLSYFPLGERCFAVEDALARLPFRNLEELKDGPSNLPLEEKDMAAFFNTLKILEGERIPKRGKLEDFIQILERYLDEPEQIIERDYEVLQDEELYRRDRQTLEHLQDLPRELKRYQEFYSEISLGEFQELLLDILEELPSESLKNREGIRLTNLSKGYYGGEEHCFFVGFEGKYETGLSQNILYRRSREADLKQLGLLKNEMEGDFLKFLNIIHESKTTTFILKEGEEGYGSLFHLLNGHIPLPVKRDEAHYITGEHQKYPQTSPGERNMDLSSFSLHNLRQILELRKFSVTDFDLYAACKRKFLLERLFHLDEYRKQKRDSDYMEQGIFYHKILEYYFRDWDENFNGERLQKLILQAMDLDQDIKPEELPFLQKVHFFNHYRILEAYLKVDLEDLKESGYRPVAREEWFEFNSGRFVICGKIDRIDGRGNVEKLTDYKLSRGRTTKDIEAFKSFQFPVYAWSRLVKEKQIAECRYGLLRKGEIQNVLRNMDHVEKNRQRCNFEGETFHQLLKDSMTEITNLHSQMLCGDFEDDGEDCKYCNFQLFCYKR